jgi:hypothetical protein
MRMLQLLSVAIIGYIVWKLIKIARAVRNSKEPRENPSVDFPQDHSYKNIEDADFEDISRDPDKTT